MLLDPETLDLAHGIEQVLAAVPERVRATRSSRSCSSRCSRSRRGPAPTCAEAAARARRRCGELVGEIAADHGMLLGAAGTHPFARCDDQRIVERHRYLELVARARLHRRPRADLRHPRPRRDRLRRQGDLRRRRDPPLPAAAAGALVELAVLGGAGETGMHSSRTPVFRAFPRSGVPPHYGSWEIFSGRVEQMIRSGAIDDYTYLWWDVRPHPTARHGRDADLRPGDRARGHRRLRGPDPVARAPLRRRPTTTASRSSRCPASWSTTTRCGRRLRGMDGRAARLQRRRPRPGAGAGGAAARARSRPSAAELGCAERARAGSRRSSPTAPARSASSRSPTPTAAIWGSRTRGRGHRRRRRDRRLGPPAEPRLSSAGVSAP